MDFRLRLENIDVEIMHFSKLKFKRKLLHLEKLTPRILQSLNEVFRNFEFVTLTFERLQFIKVHPRKDESAKLCPEKSVSLKTFESNSKRSYVITF